MAEGGDRGNEAILLPRSLRVVRSGMAQPPLPVTSHLNRPVPESIPGQKIVDPDALYNLKDHLRRLCHRHDLRLAHAPRTGGARSRAQVSRLATRLVRLSFAGSAREGRVRGHTQWSQADALQLLGVRKVRRSAGARPDRLDRPWAGRLSCPYAVTRRA